MWFNFMFLLVCENVYKISTIVIGKSSMFWLYAPFEQHGVGLRCLTPRNLDTVKITKIHTLLTGDPFKQIVLF